MVLEACKGGELQDWFVVGALVMTYILLRDYDILPKKKELHLSLGVGSSYSNRNWEILDPCSDHEVSNIRITK